MLSLARPSRRLVGSSRLPKVAAGSLALALSLPTANVVAQTPLPPPYNYDEPLPKPPSPLPDWQALILGSTRQSYRMPVYANHNLADGLKDIRRVIVVLPSARRKAGQHYQDIAPLVTRDPDRKADTLILALEFPTSIDASFTGFPAWRKANWETGGESVQSADRPAPMSAFQVLDDIVLRLTDRQELPALTDIVLAAHGSGAQLLQRYAVLNDLDGMVRRHGSGLRYVVANAPSYLYLTDERPRRNRAGYAPYERGICPTYNQYPYGPQQLPPYAQDPASASLYVRYAARDVVYLLGSADNNPEGRGLDKHCGAMAQGATRLSRGQDYLRYDHLLANRGNQPIKLMHVQQHVMKVGHDAAGMFRSECGTRALLGDDAQAADRAATCETITPLP